MFVQHMLAVLKHGGRMATVMPHGVLFRGGEEREARKYFIEQGYLEAVIGLPGNLFYGTGIPACILVLNKAGANKRDSVLFINTDREYREGKAQNHLRPEDIDKIVYAYRKGEEIPAYARPVPIEEIREEDYNCNIRRYVDNAPPPEAHDVRAHLQGGVPVCEIESLSHYWNNYTGLKDTLFAPRDSDYKNFAPEVTDKREIARIINDHPGVNAANRALMDRLENWWDRNLPVVEALAPDADNQQARSRNVYVMRTQLLRSMETALVDNGLLTSFQVRGALATYFDNLKSDFKSIAASGWGPGLIPEDDILQSQFPEVLEEQRQAQERLAELHALFAAAEEEDFEDSDDTGVLPAEEVKNKRAELKALHAEWKQQLKSIKELAANLFTELKAADKLPKGCKKGYYCTEGLTAKAAEFSNGLRIVELAEELGHESEWIDPLREAIAQGQQAWNTALSIETSLTRHKALEDEAKELKATLKAIENKRDELVASAREKISVDEARTVIIDRLRIMLLDIYQGYLRAEQRACIKAVENLWDKYAVTARQIEAKRDEASRQLQEFLVELGYV
jgi:type I restriction enzyme M protein